MQVRGADHRQPGVGWKSGPISYSEIDKIAGLAHVKAAAGGLSLTDNQISISSTSASPPTQFSVQGVDLAHDNLGPLSSRHA